MRMQAEPRFGMHEDVPEGAKFDIQRREQHEAEAVRSSLKRKIDEIIRGEWTGFDLNVFATRLEELGGKSLSKKSLNLLKELLTSQFSDTRNTAQSSPSRNRVGRAATDARTRGRDWRRRRKLPARQGRD